MIEGVAEGHLNIMRVTVYRSLLHTDNYFIWTSRKINNWFKV